MDDVLRAILQRLDALERTTPKVRLGEVTDDSPLTVTLGGSDVEIPGVPTLTAVETGDPILALTYGNGIVVLGEVGDLGEWTAYTPTVTTVTLGTGGSNQGRYRKHGRTVHAAGAIVLGSGGSFTGSDITIGLPFPTGPLPQIGSALAVDAGNVVYLGNLLAAAAGSTFITRLGNNAGGVTVLGATTPFTWASGDFLYWQITYEAAA